MDQKRILAFINKALTWGFVYDPEKNIPVIENGNVVGNLPALIFAGMKGRDAFVSLLENSSGETVVIVIQSSLESIFKDSTIHSLFAFLLNIQEMRSIELIKEQLEQGTLFKGALTF